MVVNITAAEQILRHQLAELKRIPSFSNRRSRIRGTWAIKELADDCYGILRFRQIGIGHMAWLEVNG